jgi:erythromycin esterase-like protein
MNNRLKLDVWAANRGIRENTIRFFESQRREMESLDIVDDRLVFRCGDTYIDALQRHPDCEDLLADTKSAERLQMAVDDVLRDRHRSPERIISYNVPSIQPGNAKEAVKVMNRLTMVQAGVTTDS